MGSKRIFLGLAFGVFAVAPGCANVIGLGSFSVGDGAGSGGNAVKGGGTSGADSGGGSSGRTGTSAGANNGAEAGAVEDAGTGGTSASGGSSGSSGTAGVGGATCATNCDDQNECTDDSCVAGKCVNKPVSAGNACGTGLSCDANGVCVRCRDTAAGTAQDAGCSPGAPICVGLGAAATCSGCSTNTDCDDGNDCTTEKCSNGSCAFAPVAPGQACTGGVCNGTAGAEKCVACADDATAPTKDTGCTAAKPVCDTTSTPTCYACSADADCDDGVSCTNEKCTNHVCSHTPDDTKCTSSGNVCSPNRCDPVLNCKQVVLTPATSTLLSNTTSNGSFEQVTVVSGTSNPIEHEADGWDDPGDDYVIYSCPCTTSAGTTAKDPNGGNYAAWLAGTPNAAVDEIDQGIALPVGTTTLHIQADTNVQTKSTAATNHDSFQFRLLDANHTLLGTAVATLSNVGAQTTTTAWTNNGIDQTVDVSAQGGKTIYVDLWSSVDATLPTDFFVDNVRITATYCQ